MRICDINKVYDDKFPAKESSEGGLKEAVKYKKIGYEDENVELKEEL
jgi:hypothetical protein